MATITDLSRMAARVGQPPTLWRDELLPAHYDGCLFHVESGSWEGGRRIVTHQFPKKELPYSEDMGRKAAGFTVRGYIICYPHDDTAVLNENPNTLYQRDYRAARERLQFRLDQGGPGVLQLPSFVRRQMRVVCTQYRLTEETRAGGYCTFDMSFTELGVKPFSTTSDTRTDLAKQSNDLKNAIINVWSGQAGPVTPSWLTQMRMKGTKGGINPEWLRQMSTRNAPPIRR